MMQLKLLLLLLLLFQIKLLKSGFMSVKCQEELGFRHVASHISLI